MFDIAWSEYFFLFILALIFLGPKEIPIVFHAVGKWVRFLSQISSNVQHYFLSDSFSDKKENVSVFSLPKPSCFLVHYPLQKPPLEPWK